ncbi:MAG: hypothetical protein WC549_01955 [Actinomycetota bacterium]
MQINYLVPKINVFNERQLFIYPCGTKTAIPIKEGKEYRVLFEQYEHDLYTANGFLTKIPTKKLQSVKMNVIQIKQFFILDKIDFYPYWVIGIDRLIRYKGMNIREAIEYQINIDRQKLYDELMQLEISMFPSAFGVKGK